MKRILAGIFFSAVPALVAFVIVAQFNMIVGAVAGAFVFGFGLDVCFRGSDKEV